ncbi:hypothetical protein QFZ51_006209 [Chitinophaga sp. W3I9]|uniref:hypothetical protein n=1 Tax=Chitinophaga sp. W3I9 TaxID=3373924 RepID=UPI003D1C7ACC
MGNKTYTATIVCIAAMVVIFITVRTVRKSSQPEYLSNDKAGAAAAVALDEATVQAAVAVDSVTYEMKTAAEFPLSVSQLRDATAYLLHEQLQLDSHVVKKKQTFDLALMWHSYVQPLYYEGESEDPYNTTAYTKNHGLEPAIRQLAWTGRDEARLRASFASYKNLLYEMLPYNTYQRSPARYYVEKLLLTYSALQANENVTAQLEKFYIKMAISTDHGPSENFIGEVRQVLSSMIRVDPSLNNNDLGAHRMTVWLVSFWARRYNEGNQQAVYEILKEISDMYSR